MRQIDKESRDNYLAKISLIKSGAAANPFESEKQKTDRIERAKKDVKFFVEYYLSHYATSECADFQIKLANRIAKDQTCRELVRWGRGLAKSVWCDVIIPLWLWSRGESLYFVIVGNTEKRAKELLSDLQAEFEANRRIAHDFGDQFLRGSWENGDFSTTDRRLHGMALGMKQTVRGLRKSAIRPNYIVCDDLEDQLTQKNPKRQDEIVKWIENDLLKTMDGDIERYLHPNNDPFERSIQNQLEKRHPEWHCDIVKAYDKVTYKPAWSSKYSDDYYLKKERDGILSAHAEYLHEPLIEGSVFTKNLIQWAVPPKLKDFRVITGHWDVAYSGKNDFNAVRVMGLESSLFWHLKAFCRQCKMEDAIRWMYYYESTLPKGVIVQWRVEEQFWGDPVIQAIDNVRIEQNRWLNISIVKRSRENKLSRIMTLHPYYQNSRIKYAESEFADNDMNVSIKQLYGIEPSYNTHDDAPDAEQQSVEYLATFVSYNTDTTSNRVETSGARRNNRM